MVQNQNGFTDYYALSKSSDFLTSVLIESVYSEKFLDEVNGTNLVNTNFLPGSKLERLKTWEKIVKIKKNPNVGIISIEVLGDSQKQVLDVSNAILNVLSNKYFLFLGKGQDLDIRVLSGPITEKNPTVANIIFAVVGGFLVGSLLSYFWIAYRQEKIISHFSQIKNSADEYSESLNYLDR